MSQAAFSWMLIFAWVVIALGADTLFKAAPSIWSTQFFAGVVLYTSSAAFAYYSYRHAQWGWIGVAWGCLALVLGTAMSVVIYHEPLTGRRLTAVGLLMIAMLLAE